MTQGEGLGYYLPPQAEVAELADAQDSKSCGTWYHGGSTPPFGTTDSQNPLCNCELNYPATSPVVTDTQESKNLFRADQRNLACELEVKHESDTPIDLSENGRFSL